MNITQFSPDMVKTPSEAKNLFNVMIRDTPKTPNVLDSFVAAYDSLPDHIKADERIFAKSFYMLFLHYEMQEHHVKYYKKFKDFWSVDDVAVIKSKGGDLLKNEEPQTFKNSLEFAKSLNSVFIMNTATHAFEFIAQHYGVIETLIKKDQKKFVANLHKQRCWGMLIQADYNVFKKVCADFNLDFRNIVKNAYINKNTMYGFNYLCVPKNDLLFIEMFDDMRQRDDFFKDISFFSRRDDKLQQSHYNVLEVCLGLLSQTKIESFTYLFNTYAHQLQHCMQPYLPGEIDISKTAAWDNVLTRLIDLAGRQYSGEVFKIHELPNMETTIRNNFKVIHKMLMDTVLPEKEELKKSKMKI